MAQSTSLFTEHSRGWREHRYAYPVISRRARGLSIGINLSPSKACTFDCVYCSVDRTVPGNEARVDLDLLASELDGLLRQAADGSLFAEGPLAQTPPELRRLNDLAFSGNGEPTAAQEFPEAAEIAANALERRGLTAKVVVITNSTLLHRAAVARALASLDGRGGEIWAKLDAGTEEHYRLIDRSSVPLERIVANLREAGRARAIVIQSMFAMVHGEPPPEREIDAWLGRLRDLAAGGCRIGGVQVYTCARRTAEPFVRPLGDAALDAIAERVRGINLPAETFYGPRAG